MLPVSQAPSVIPSLSPSSLPTLLPSSTPTLSPTRSPYDTFDATIYQSKWVLDPNQPVFTAYVNNAADYTSQMSKWNSFVLNSLGAPFNLNRTMIRVKVTGMDSSVSDRVPYHMNITCSNSNTTNYITKGLTTTSTSSVSKSILCDSIPVFFRKSTLCWNCDRSDACMNPRIGRFSFPGTTACVSSSSSFPKFALSMTFYQIDQTLKSVPKLNSLTLIPDTTNITVRALFQPLTSGGGTGGGLIYCHPFYNYSISTISRSLIKSVGTSAVIKSSSASSSSSSNLVTFIFKIWFLWQDILSCYVTDSLGNGYDLKTVLQYRQDVQTVTIHSIS
jgi:hypothetical protein